MIDELDDASLDGDDEPEPRGDVGEYIHYVRARSLLAQRLGATPQEIAIWTWFGRDLKGKPAGGLDGFLDPEQHQGRPPRFRFEEDTTGAFDYVPQLMACYYRLEDVQAFEPEDRYLTHDRVVRRFTKCCSTSEAVALIRAKASTGELDPFHPQTGGTKGTRAWGSEEGIAPLEHGLFPLTQVQAVEAESLGVVPSPQLQSPGSFVALHQFLEGYWDLPLAELPREHRDRLRVAYFPHVWDSLTVDQRRSIADQLDYQHDPALEPERSRASDERLVDWRYWREFPTLSASEFTALRHVCDPRKLESLRDVIPGGEGPTLGQRIQNDLRRIEADPVVSSKNRMTLRQWIQWAEKAGLSCPTFMHARVETDSARTEPPAKAGITPSQFIKDHGHYVQGGKRFLDKWFKGEKRTKGERPEAAPFRIARGRYDEEAMVAALKAAGRYSEIR